MSGLDGLLDEPRPGQPRKLSDAQIEQVIVRTLESKRPLLPIGLPHDGPGHRHQPDSNQPHLARFFPGPHRAETFKLSKDPCSSTRCATSWALYESSGARAGSVRR